MDWILILNIVVLIIWSVAIILGAEKGNRLNALMGILFILFAMHEILRR